MTVRELGELLRRHPADARLYAYEGVVPGLVVAEPDGLRVDFIFLPRDQQGPHS